MDTSLLSQLSQTSVFVLEGLDAIVNDFFDMDLIWFDMDFWKGTVNI